MTTYSDINTLMHVAASYGMQLRRIGRHAIGATPVWRALLYDGPIPENDQGDTWIVHRIRHLDSDYPTDKREAYGGATAIELAGCLEHIGLTFDETPLPS